MRVVRGANDWLIWLVAVAASCGFAASVPWKNDNPSAWSERDLDQILNESPWAQPAGASFTLAADDEAPAPPSIDVPTTGQPGMPAPRNAATDGRWDGGVAKVNRNGPPTLTVTVRWESARPVREALTRQHAHVPFSEDQVQKDYIISVLGLVPGGRYGDPKLKTQSTDENPSDPRSEEARNPEEMLEGVMRYSKLYLRNGASMRPENVKLDPPSGVLYLFFSRSQPVTAKDKEVTFETRFGSLSVAKRFRLKDMMFAGRLEL